MSILRRKMHWRRFFERGLHPEQLSGLRVPWRRATVFAGGDSGQCDQIPPAERGSGGGEFLAVGSIELLGVQRPVLADGELQQQIEHRARRMTQLPVPRDDRTRMRLKVPAN